MGREDEGNSVRELLQSGQKVADAYVKVRALHAAVVAVPVRDGLPLNGARGPNARVEPLRLARSIRYAGDGSDNQREVLPEQAPENEQ